MSVAPQLGGKSPAGFRAGNMHTILTLSLQHFSSEIYKVGYLCSTCSVGGIRNQLGVGESRT